MLDQRGRRAWDTYTARLRDALDAVCVPPVPQRPHVYGRASRSRSLRLTADRLSGAMVRSVGTFRSNFERLPERSGRKHLRTRWQAPCAHACEFPSGASGTHDAQQALRPTWVVRQPHSMPCRRSRCLPAVIPSRTAMMVWLRAPRPLSLATPFACAWQTATWRQRSMRSSRPRFIAINL